MTATLTARPTEEYEPAVIAAGAFVFYEKHGVAEFPEHLATDYGLFQQALAGEDVVAPSALERRAHPGKDQAVSAAG